MELDLAQMFIISVHQSSTHAGGCVIRQVDRPNRPTWLTEGGNSAPSRISRSCAARKLETPTLRASPSFLSASTCFHTSLRRPGSGKCKGVWTRKRSTYSSRSLASDSTSVSRTVLPSAGLFSFVVTYSCSLGLPAAAIPAPRDSSFL